MGLGYQFLRVMGTLPNVPNRQSDGFVPVHSYWEFDYFRSEQPIPREDGSLPESNDFQLVVGVSIKVG